MKKICRAVAAIFILAAAFFIFGGKSETGFACVAFSLAAFFLSTKYSAKERIRIHDEKNHQPEDKNCDVCAVEELSEDS